MRSRSSRLFIVLLHLVGVSTNLPCGLHYWNVGIVGVHPMAILLESLELDSAGGLDGLLKRLPAGYGEGLLSEPYWLQDNIDGKCLGEIGFSECGDATLWIIRRRKIPTQKAIKQNKIFNFLSTTTPGKMYESSQDEILLEDPSQYDWGYALQLVDTEMHANNIPVPEELDDKKKRKRNMHKKEKDDKQCLIVTNNKNKMGDGRDRRKKKNDAFSGRIQRELEVELGPCSADIAWNWRIDGKGRLSQELSLESMNKSRKSKFSAATSTGAKSQPKRESESNNVDDVLSLCVSRTNSTEVTTSLCNNRKETGAPVDGQGKPNETDIRNIVRFSLVRFQVNANVHTSVVPPSDPTSEEIFDTLDNQKVGILSTADDAQHSIIPIKKPLSMLPSFDEAHTKSMVIKKSSESVPPHHPCLLSKRSSPPLLFSPLHPALHLNTAYITTTNKNTEVKNIKPSKMGDPVSSTKKLLHHPPSSSASPGASTVPHQRRMPMHPYIASSNDGVWKDPVTGLEYLTDLSVYLGHTKKESGRHTLMGVGQYVKTMLKIKVYGVALYVSKRDVLSDTTFKQFAHLDASELRSSPEFYKHLMTTTPEGHRGFDRTIMIKTNMQLGTDTMRQSLDSDWSYLTPELKQMLIESSFRKRPAVKGMLDRIEGKENSNNCSCGQAAPEEYGADPSCCARGTELVFTWRKNGNTEVRLDGRLMDVFPRADMAGGIFYEYLRGDEPMSWEAREKFCDGFPFLLAPLAQVKGVFVGQTHAEQQQRPTTTTPKRTSGLRFIGDLAGTVGTQAHGFANFMGEQAHGVAHIAGSQAASILSVVQAIPSESISKITQIPNGVEHAARELGGFMNKNRDNLFHHVSIGSSNTALFVSQKIPFLPEEWRKQLLSHLRPVVHPTDIELHIEDWVEGIGTNSVVIPRRRGVLSPGGSFGQTDLPFVFSGGPLVDEIRVIIGPRMNFTHYFFFCIVHLYLMLLLIVSLPESGNTRTRLSLKRCRTKRNIKNVSVHVSLGSKTTVPQDQVNTIHAHQDGSQENASTPCGEEASSLEVTEKQKHATKMKKALSYYL